jgi:hypothetical protein
MRRLKVRVLPDQRRPHPEYGKRRIKMASKDIRINYISLDELFDIVKNVCNDSNFDVRKSYHPKDLAHKVNDIINVVAETLDRKINRFSNPYDLPEVDLSDEEPSYGYNEWKYAKNNESFFKGQSSFDSSKKL